MTASSWNCRKVVSRNMLGMCLRMAPGMPSGPGALWLGVRRTADLKTAGVRKSMIAVGEGGGREGRDCGQGKGPSVEMSGSWARAFCWKSSMMLITRGGSEVAWPVEWSWTTESLVGIGALELWFCEVGRERIAFRAAFGFLRKSFRREEPYAARRAELACLMVRRVAMRWAL